MLSVALLARTGRSTGYEPDLIQNESGTKCMSSAVGDDEDLIGIENSQFEQRRRSCSSNGTERPACSSPSIPRYTAYGEVPVLPQELRYSTQHMVHDIRDCWKNPSYSALQISTGSLWTSCNCGCSCYES